MPRGSKNKFIVPALFSLAIAALWVFPQIWYTRQGAEKPIWFAERSDIQGWEFSKIPISESAESVLVADRTVNGEFRQGEKAVRVFSAKRYQEKSNEIGLFVHTPDRCWVDSGWTIEPLSPDVFELDLHGAKLTLERRIFSFRGQRELVYFCGLVGGQPLPYRLDHNLSVGLRTALKMNSALSSAARASDALFWKRLWTSFSSRRALDGPKQFFRISTPLRDDLAQSDQLLRGFLANWLVPGDYDAERRALHTVALQK